MFREEPTIANTMAKQSETPTKCIEKLFGGDHDDYNACVCFMGEGRGTPHRHDTRKVIDLNCKNLTSQWDFFLSK